MRTKTEVGLKTRSPSQRPVKVFRMRLADRVGDVVFRGLANSKPKLASTPSSNLPNQSTTGL